ncbi:hypothetical protein [Pseudoxanthomonas mexicana]|uniref:hypothetical protein n=1 Tax=Pseudoxanthomonas mexicana TaxID=128785 RepID=UPI00398B91C4
MRGLSPSRLTGMTVPMSVWALHLLLVYSLGGIACARGWPRERIGGVETVIWLQLGATLLAWLLLAWLGMRAWRTLRAASVAGAGPRDRRRRFVARLTLALSATAALAVLFTTIPAAMLPPCAG